MNKWVNINNLKSKSFVCGHCGENISSERGFYTTGHGSPSLSDAREFIYICHNCNKPTFIDELENKTPGSLYGKMFEVEIPNLINNLYEEAKRCYSVNAFTAVGLCCRKLLMHIAVECGALKGLRFIEYVNYLDDENYIPKNSKKWVDIIRQKGNEVNHEILILSEKDAKQLIMFSEIIINLIYENELLLSGEEDV